MQLKQFCKKIIFSVAKKVGPYLLCLPQTRKKNRRNPDAKLPRVMIVGRNYCSNLCLARSFGAAGYDIEIIRVFLTNFRIFSYIKLLLIPDAYSKYIKAFRLCITTRESRALVDQLIALADPARKMLLIPAEDLSASIIDSHYDLLKNYYHIPSVAQRQNGINELMSKQIQTSLARKAGLPVLNSCLIQTENGNFSIPETVTYPCFTKPNISKNSTKTTMAKCDDEAQLRQHLRAISAEGDIEMLVEDFVDIRQEYSLLGLSTREGVIIPGFFGMERCGHGGRKGVAMAGTVVSPAQQQDLIDRIGDFVASLDYEGLFDVDLIETADGRFYFVELNLRYGGSGYAITGSGANLPGMFAHYMLQNQPIDKNCATVPGKQFVSEKVLFEEYATGFLSKREMEDYIRNADIHFIKDPADPGAFRFLRLFILAAGPMRLLVALKKALLKK